MSFNNVNKLRTVTD